MSPERNPSWRERLFDWVHHPFVLIGMAFIFFASALFFSRMLADAAGNVSGTENRDLWRLMVLHAFYGVVAFGVGIRALCLRQVESNTQLRVELEGPSAISPARMNDAKTLSLFALGTWVWSGINWTAGHHNLALAILALTPLCLFCWGLSFLFSSSKKREFIRNMSGADRARLEVLTREYGKLGGIYIGVPLGVIAALSYYLSGQDAQVTAAVFVVSLLLSMPLAYRLAAPLRSFTRETDSSQSEY